MSLLASLPAPKRAELSTPAAASVSIVTTLATVGRAEPPPYGRRNGFVPRRNEDFGDGGAFPEIHVAQYPLDMGRPDAAKGGKTLAISVDSEGQASYDAILRQGQNRDRIIHSGHGALVPKMDLLDPKNLTRPDDDEVAKAAKETAAALQRVVEGKLASTQPTTLPAQPGGPTYIKYTPSQQGAAYASGAKQRIIKLQDMPVDPLEPPKFRHTKVPRGTGSPPVPVMHSPPRPVTAQDQANWKIPPCVSNWKNAKGYTIPLDKRLAADGRGLQEVTISDKFAGLSEALLVAESKAREAVEMRARVQKEMMVRQKAAKEAELRELAMRARQERLGAAMGGGGVGGGLGGVAARADSGAAGAGAAAYPPPPPASGYPPPPPSTRGGDGGGESPGSSPERDGRGGYARGGALPEGFEETAAEREARRRRDEIREERRRERERERRLESRDSGAAPSKKSKLTRDRDRDIGERVALGMANVAGGAGGTEVQYDTRLFNQEQGVGTGFGADDSYSLYDKALFASRDTNLFRPVRGADDEAYGGDAGGTGAGGDAAATARFRADRGFKGAEGEGDGGRKGGGAVEYEKAGGEADPFGLDQFLSEVSAARRDKRGGGRALDGIGARGGMAAAGGGGMGDEGGGGGSRRMDFVSGRP